MRTLTLIRPRPDTRARRQPSRSSDSAKDFPQSEFQSPGAEQIRKSSGRPRGSEDRSYHRTLSPKRCCKSQRKHSAPALCSLTKPFSPRCSTDPKRSPRPPELPAAHLQLSPYSGVRGPDRSVRSRGQRRETLTAARPPGPTKYAVRPKTPG